MRPDQTVLPGTSGAPTTTPPEAQVVGEHERQLPVAVQLIGRTGKGKVQVQSLLGTRSVWAVYPWRLRDRHSLRKRLPTSVLRALPWHGAGNDPGVPLGDDEKDENQGDLSL